MRQNNRFTPFAIPIIIGVVLQIQFIFPDMRDTPAKAATEFTVAYFKADRSMIDRLCNQSKIRNGVDTVDQYIEAQSKEARDRGFGLSYTPDRVYDLRIHIISRDDSSAKLRVTGKVKPTLKSFFSLEPMLGGLQAHRVSLDVRQRLTRSLNLHVERLEEARGAPGISPGRYLRGRSAAGKRWALRPQLRPGSGTAQADGPPRVRDSQPNG